jgi:hypothetical protein
MLTNREIVSRVSKESNVSVLYFEYSYRRKGTENLGSRQGATQAEKRYYDVLSEVRNVERQNVEIKIEDLKLYKSLSNLT